MVKLLQFTLVLNAKQKEITGSQLRSKELQRETTQHTCLF